MSVCLPPCLCQWGEGSMSHEKIAWAVGVGDLEWVHQVCQLLP